MDTSLNVKNGGQQFELQFPPIDPSAYEGLNSYSDAGPTRNRKSRLHLTAPYSPYSRNNNSINRSAQADFTSITWLRAIFSSLLPSFMSKFLGLTSSRNENRISETISPILDQKNNNEMDIDQYHEGSNGVQERLVQSNRIFTEQTMTNLNDLSSKSRRRPETIQNNSIKRKRSDTSIEVVEEKLLRKAQIEDQNHQPDLKELYFKNIDPNWYKPFKNNPDNYPKFASSSRVTSDTYGPDQNLNLPKETPPLKKFKPSVIPTPRWFDYHPDKDEDIIDKRRTENIVEKRKAEEKIIEKASYKNKKGKEREAGINLETKEEKPCGATTISSVNISPLNDKNYFAIDTQTPAVVTSPQRISPQKISPQRISPPIENQPQTPSTVVNSSKITITTDDRRNNIVTTPETTSQSIKSPSSMESIVYTHENKDDIKPNLEKTQLTDAFTNSAAEDKNQPANIINNDSSFIFQKDQLLVSASLTSEPKSDVLADNSTSSTISEKDDKQLLVPLPNELVEKEETIVQEYAVDNNEAMSLSSSFPPVSNNVNNVATPNDIFVRSPFFNNLKDIGKNSTNGEMEKIDKPKTPSSQPQDNRVATTTFFNLNSATSGDKIDSLFSSALAPTAVSTTASTYDSTFSFNTSSRIFNGYNQMITNGNNNHVGKLEKEKTSKSHRQSVNNRNKKNKISNQKNTKTDQASTRLQVPFPGTFNFSAPSSTSLFGSGNENASSSQPAFSFDGGVQVQKPPSTPSFAFGVSNPPSFDIASNQTSASNTGFNNTNSMLIENTTTTSNRFSFGTNSAIPTSVGLTNPVSTIGNPNQNLFGTTFTEFRAASNFTPAPNINNLSNNYPNQQQVVFESNTTMYSQQSFNFNDMGNSNANQNQGFNSGRRIRKVRGSRRKP